jgi:glyoxylase-like metal-dependent hydrolase (beta-lactamase superfamily II)
LTFFHVRLAQHSFIWPKTELPLAEHRKPTNLKGVISSLGGIQIMLSQNYLKISLATTAFALAACTTTQARPHVKADASAAGRILEYKSGPEGFDTRTYFYEAQNEVIAFDSQFTPELARQSINFLRSHTQKPITWLVITHPNPDKFNGTSEFKKEGARIISSRATSDAIPGVHAYKKYFFVNMAKMFTDETYPVPAAIDETFDKNLTLRLSGGEEVQLSEFGVPGVSSNQTVAFLPLSRTLVVGDLIHHNAHAWLEGGIVDGKPTPTLTSWKEILQKLDHTYPSDTTVLGGRGETVNLRVGVRAQIRYLTKAEELVRKFVHDLPVGANPDFQKLTSLFELAFPQSSLPYMIQYGVYGLVNSEIARQR